MLVYVTARRGVSRYYLSDRGVSHARFHQLYPYPRRAPRQRLHPGHQGPRARGKGSSPT